MPIVYNDLSVQDEDGDEMCVSHNDGGGYFTFTNSSGSHTDLSVYVTDEEAAIVAAYLQAKTDR